MIRNTFIFQIVIQNTSKKCIYLYKNISCIPNEKMKKFSYNSTSNHQNDEYSSPNNQKNQDSSQIQQIHAENYNTYIRVQPRKQKIDEEAILRLNRQINYQVQQELQVPTVNKKKKSQKVPLKPLKKHDLSYIKMKWRGKMDEQVEKFKNILNEQKKSYDFKEKENLLDFFKILLEGYYELKQHQDTFPNQLTKNQKIIVSQICDFIKWIKSLVGDFDLGFKEALQGGKVQSTKQKWKFLIKNMRIQANFELRRKILTKKIKPIDIINNNSEFLMSEQARILAEREAKQILAQASINLQRIAILENNYSSQQEQCQNSYLHDEHQDNPSTYSIDNIQRRINRDRQNLKEFKQAISEEMINKLKERIIQDLKGTSSYERVMADFISKFGN